MDNATIRKHGGKKVVFIIIALLAAAVCLLAGCGKDKENAAETDAAVLPSSVTVPEGDMTSASDSAGPVVSASDWYSRLDGEELAIADMIIRSTEAFNSEDIDAYMRFIDASSPGYDSTREDTAELFDNYQLIAAIDDIKIDSLNESKGTAKVTVTQTTFRDGKEGKGFAPVQNVLSHELVKRGEEWFFRSTTVISRRELTDRWGMFIEFASHPPVSDTDAPEESEVG